MLTRQTYTVHAKGAGGVKTKTLQLKTLSGDLFLVIFPLY